MIATLATRADEAGCATCVVSTDRDAFQLVSDNVCLMMTPRGVADVHVYTPERVDGAPRHAAGEGPRLHRPQGRHLRLHRGRARHRRQDRGAADPAVRLGRGRARARRRAVARAREVAPRARRPGARIEGAGDDAARPRHRLRSDGARARAARPLRAAGDVPPLRVPRRSCSGSTSSTRRCPPPTGRRSPGEELPWREGERTGASGAFGYSADDGRSAIALADEVVVAPRAERIEGEIVVHDAKPLRVVGRRRHAARRVPHRAGPHGLRPRRPRCRVRHRARPSPPAEEETEALVRRAALPLRLAPLMRARLEERDLDSAVRGRRAAAVARAGARWRTRASASTRTAWARSPRGFASGSRSSRAARTSWRARSSCSGSTQQVARVLFEKLGLTPGRKGKTGYSTDTRVLRTIRDEHPIVRRDRGVARADEARSTRTSGRCPTLLGEDGRLHTTFNQAVASTGRLSTSNPNLQSIPIRTELGREIRSAFVAEDGQQAAVRRLLADRAAHPRPRLRRAEAARARSRAARTSTPRRPPRCSAGSRRR